MPIGQLIATVDCFTQEIILDVQGGTATGNFSVMFPDATTQVINGTLPLTITSDFSGMHVFYNTSLDASSTVTSVVATSLDVNYTNCEEVSDMSYCLFNLNNAYEKAKCINDKQALIEKKKLDRAMQLLALIENITECGVDQLDKYKAELNTITNCDNCTTLDDDIWGDYEVYGCTDPNADNYNPAANIDDGTCDNVVFGCTNPIANNYDPLATTDDGSCTFDIYGCTDATASNYDSTATIDDGSCIPCVYGCTDNTAVNYDSLANCDDGSCLFPVYGCTDSNAINYNSAATIDDGSCIYGSSDCANNSTTTITVGGSTYYPNTYINYNSSALYDCNGEVLGTTGDSSTGPQNTGYDDCCTPCIFGCTDPTSGNYNPLATCNDYSCITYVYGCTDPLALNYYAGAQIDDGTCVYVAGCTDSAASNYDPSADFDDGSCLYCTVYGCTDPTASNYDPTADCDDGSCTPFIGPCLGSASIPDNNFEDYLESNGMGNGVQGDNLVLKSNICNVIEISDNEVTSPWGKILSLEGIEYFLDLEQLFLQSHNPKNTHGTDGIWDFNSNVQLENIWITEGTTSITSVVFDQCPNLETIVFWDSNIDCALDVTNNTKIKSINIGRASGISAITGLSNCTLLEYINFDSCHQIDNLDLYQLC